MARVPVIVAAAVMMVAAQVVSAEYNYYYYQTQQPPAAAAPGGARKFKNSHWHDGSATFYGDSSGLGADFGTYIYTT